MTSKVIILGAGLAGLSAAYHLSADYEIYEKESEAGGLCRSRHIDGFTFDYAVHAFYSQDKYAADLVEKLLGSNLSRHHRSAYIYSSGVFTPYPFQANTFGLPVETVKDCVVGFAEALCSDNQQEQGNFQDWIYSTFGSGIAEHFMIPFNGKLWGVDLQEMSACWIDSRVPLTSMVDVVAGALRRQKREFGPNSCFWYPQTGGIEALPASSLPHVKNLHLNQEVASIHSEEHCIILADGSTRGYDRLISTLPLTRLIEILDDVPENIQDAANQLRYNSIYLVNIGLDRANISDMHWVYFPEQQFSFHRISFPMNFSSDMTPEHASSIAAEISAYSAGGMGEDELLRRAVDDLIMAQILKTDDEILVTDVVKIEPAYVIYDHLHEKNVTLIHDFLEARDIFPCGRFGMWEYYNMDQAILSGKAAAEKAQVSLR